MHHEGHGNTFLCNARCRSMEHDPESAKRLPGNRAQRDLSVILWISRSTRFHVQHARGRSSRSSVMLCCFKSRPAPTVRNELSNLLLWIIRSGNLPGPAFQPHKPHDETGSRLPTISRPPAFFCDVFPSTTNLDRFRFEKRRRRMICVVMGGAWRI